MHAVCAGSHCQNQTGIFLVTFQVVKGRPQVRLGGRAWPACSVRSRCRHGTWAQGGTPPHTAASPGTPWLKQPAAKQ